MRNLLAFVGAAVVAFLGLGWYLGWYNVSPQKSGPGQSRLQVDINQDKIGKDVEKGAGQLRDMLNKGEQEKPAGTKTEVPPTSAKPSARSEEAFKGFILDGWFSSEKK